jgi:hypothetical protein
MAGHTKGRCARSTDCFVATAETAAAAAETAASPIAIVEESIIEY